MAEYPVAGGVLALASAGPPTFNGTYSGQNCLDSNGVRWLWNGTAWSVPLQHGLPSGLLAIPGNRAFSVGASALGANFDVFYPWFVEENPIVLSGLSLEVTVAVGGASIYLGLTNCDANWLPTSNGLIVNAGSVSAATTGVKTASTGFPLTLNPGRYLALLNISAAGVSLRTVTCCLPDAPLVSGLGVSATLNLMYAARTAGAFPSTVQSPATYSGGNTGYQHHVFAGVTTP